MFMSLSLRLITGFSILVSIGIQNATAEPFKSFLHSTDSRAQLVLNQTGTPGTPLFFNQNSDAPLLRLPTNLNSVDVHVNSRGEVYLPSVPQLTPKSTLAGRLAGTGPRGEFVVFTVQTELQEFVEKTVKNIKASHAAVVVMEPRSGKILALADKSKSLKSAALHAGYPAASLFKVVTSAAALEQTQLAPKTKVRFRGGNHTLNKYNYAPSAQRDNRSMTLEEALGKSCNAVFARVALQHLSKKDLEQYAGLFGFNTDLAFDTPGMESSAVIPASDYELSRTAAGFGAVYISPVHAAAFMSAVANGGFLPRPHMVDRIISKQGSLLYRAKPEVLQRVVAAETSRTLMKMMESTTTEGTSRYAFFKKNKPYIPVRVAGKTGTLTGKNPKGLNKWFVGAAPLNAPEVAIAVLIVNPWNSTARSSYVARRVLQEYFQPTNQQARS